MQRMLRATWVPPVLRERHAGVVRVRKPLGVATLILDRRRTRKARVTWSESSVHVDEAVGRLVWLRRVLRDGNVEAYRSHGILPPLMEAAA